MFIFADGMREDLLHRDPLWATIPDSEDLLTVHLYRQAAVRIAAVVQILRGLNLDITDEEVRRFLKPASVMEREMRLRSPTEEDLPLLDIFNRLWLRSRHNLVGGRGPEVLFDLTLGRDRHLSDSVHDMVSIHVHGPRDTGDSNQSGQGEEQEAAEEQNEESQVHQQGESSVSAPEFISDVRGRQEEELDYEADEPMDGHDGKQEDEPNSRVQSGDESEESSSASSSGDEDDDQPHPPSYASAAAASPRQRKIIISNQPLYPEPAVAGSANGLVF